MFSKLRLETCTCVLQAAFVYRAVSGVARMKVMSMTRLFPAIGTPDLSLLTRFRLLYARVTVS